MSILGDGPYIYIYIYLITYIIYSGIYIYSNLYLTHSICTYSMQVSGPVQWQMVQYTYVFPDVQTRQVRGHQRREPRLPCELHRAAQLFQHHFPATLMGELDGVYVL